MRRALIPLTLGVLSGGALIAFLMQRPDGEDIALRQQFDVHITREMERYERMLIDVTVRLDAQASLLSNLQRQMDELREEKTVAVTRSSPRDANRHEQRLGNLEYKAWGK